MPYVIGAGTFIKDTITSVPLLGIQSISLDSSPEINRLWELGSTLPYDKDLRRQKKLSISRYSGSLQSKFNILASNDCSEPEPLFLTIYAADCLAGSVSDVSEWWITNYSYTKDIQGWGIESFNLISRPEIIGSSDIICRMIRGTAEGQRTINGGADTGIEFITDTTQVEGTTLEVSAGSPSIGKTFNTEFGEVATIGGGLGKGDGKEGNGQVTIPYTPIYFAI